MSERYTMVVPDEVTEPLRLDVYLSRLDIVPNRSALKQRIRAVRRNGTDTKLSARVTAGDRLEIEIDPPPPSTVVSEDIPLDVVYEDDGVVVINKAPGMVVHPGAGNWTGTLLHALAGRYPDSPFFADTPDGEDGEYADPVRPGIVHRLDKDTGGIIIVAKERETHAFLVSRFSKRKTRKIYLALVKGSPVHHSGYIDGSIGRDRFHRTKFTVLGELHRGALTDIDQPVDRWGEGGPSKRAKKALTTYTVMRRFPSGYALLMVRPHTGRTHQIRVHLAAIGYPIVGDPLYGHRDARFEGIGLMLHAWRLEIALRHGEESSRFSAPVSEEFRRGMRVLRGDGIRENT